MLRILFPFVLGIICAHETGDATFGTIQINWMIAALMVSLAVMGSMLFFFRRSPWSAAASGTFSVLLFMLSMCTGWLYTLHQERQTVPRQQPLPDMVLGTVLSPLEDRGDELRVRLLTERLPQSEVSLSAGQVVLVYLEKDSSSVYPGPGERWLFSGHLYRIVNRGNPGEFDYAGYMARRNTWFTMNVHARNTERLPGTGGNVMMTLTNRIGQKISAGWDPEDEAFALLRAITLGERSAISPETRQAFSDAGAMHLLAVSGLHVGMIWWMLQAIIMLPARFLPARIMKMLIMLSILWMYAAITGFSESVTRSVTMFSMMTLSANLKRPSNIYNTLFGSGLILLVIDPSRIQDVGFQLSYTAVFGIVSIHPLLRRRIRTSGKITGYISDLLIVSIAAQAATFPLALHYFHQFPVWFMLTNLAAIPLVTLLLAAFVLSVPFLLAGWQITIFNQILGWIARILNIIVNKISSLPAASVQTSFCSSGGEALIMLFIVFSLVAFFYYRRLLWIVSVIILSSMMLTIQGSRIRQLEGSGELVIHNFNSETLLSLRNGRTLRLFRIPGDEEDQYITDYIRSIGLRSPGITRVQESCLTAGDQKRADRPPGMTTIPGVIRLPGQLWLIREGHIEILVCGACDSDHLEILLQNLNISHVVFRRGFPYLNEQLALLLDGKTVVADGTVWRWQQDYLKEILPQAYIVSQKGAFCQKSGKEFHELEDYPLFCHFIYSLLTNENNSCRSR